MDGETNHFRANANPAERQDGARRFTRRIDCAPAPTPRRPDPLQAAPGHGYPRAPGEGA